MDWELESISDSFNYFSTHDNRPAEFTSRWVDWYINPWTGPSLTMWDRGHVWTNGSELGIQAHHDPNSNSIFMGCLSSHATFQFPMYMEARVRLSDCVLANNVWMLSSDSEEEIDMMETYPSSRPSQNYFDERMHLSHHVFIRKPFQDYQPRDEEGVFGTWYKEAGRNDWRDEWVRTGVYWKNPTHLEYYINGTLVRTIRSHKHSYLAPNGQLAEHTTTFDAIDKFNFTNGTGLSKPMHIIINMEQQSWRTDLGIIPSGAELTDSNNQNIYLVDWIRVYTGIPTTTTDTVTATSFNTFRGVLLSGDLSDVTASDDGYLQHQPGFTLNSSEAPVWLSFDSVFSNDHPNGLDVAIESSANTPSLTQTTEMFNWNTEQYDQIDERQASFNSDVVISLDASSLASDYVQDGTGAVSTRVGWRQTGFTLLSPWTISVDQVQWTAEY